MSAQRYFTRINWLQRLLWLAFLAMFLRLVYLQAWQGDIMGLRARENVLRSLPTQAPRGLIFDGRGRVLVRNQPRYTCSIVAASLSDPEAAVRRLGALADLPVARVDELVARSRARPLEPLVLADNLSDRQIARLAEVQCEVPGAQIQAVPVREYPLGALAGHLLGQVGEVDPDTLDSSRGHTYFPGEWVGKDGLELSWQEALRGRPGNRVVLVDVTGRPVQEVEVHPPESGHDLHLTLDAELQKAAETRLQAALDELYWQNGERSGGVVVAMEARTGKIRAMASLPGYDPSWFASGISTRRFALLTRDPRAPLLNRAIAGASSPGSTFKLVTATAAFGEGLIKPDQRFYCEGALNIGGTPFNCFVRSGHGWLNFEETLAHSCDVAYYGLGLKLGHERSERYAREFGIGSPTGVDLPGEVGGNLPTEAWKLENIHERWYAGDDANLSIGQGYLTVTPLQMAVVTAAVATDGVVVRPYLVDHVTDASGQVVEQVEPRVERVVAAPTAAWARIRKGMRGAVLYGTSTRANLWELPIAGKTGTVENLPSAHNPHGRNHTWFVSFGPAEALPDGKEIPELVVVVFLEKSGGYGGELAVPVARDVLLAYKQIASRPAGAKAPPVTAPPRLTPPAVVRRSSPGPGWQPRRPARPAPGPSGAPAEPAPPADGVEAEPDPEATPAEVGEPAAGEPLPESTPVEVHEAPPAEPPPPEPAPVEPEPQAAPAPSSDEP